MKKRKGTEEGASNERIIKWVLKILLQIKKPKKAERNIYTEGVIECNCTLKG